ncbi:MAG TPA: Xaa-Pro peptidase family protein [Thermoplasmata archaeon]|jgi:Xaa-Pro dipeptidase|nr:Xaa-Pro peptidase family protein [Thermoplasmata archaeon]
MKDRVRKLFGLIDPHPDAVVLANAIDPHLDQSFFYLFDVPSGLFEGSVAIAHQDGRLDVLSSVLEAESAERAAKQDPSVTVHVMKDNADRQRIVKKILPHPGTVGLNYRELTYETFRQLEKALPGAKWVDASPAIRSARMVKDASEIERLERAATIGSVVAKKIPAMLHKGISDLELAAEIEYAMGREGGSGRSFATIAGFGPDGAEPHYAPRGRKLEPGMSIVCDFGALYQRYASDITRSFHFGPRDEEMKKVHDTVFAAQEAALHAVKAGVLGKQVHLAAQKVIDDSPFKGRFTHGLGHSIGLAVHDGFGMNALVEEPLQAGMTITIEPGIYLPGKGGVRIEDDIVVTNEGYRFLTKAPREYLEVAA